MVFREIMVGHLLAWGNFYGQMIWDENGTVTEIWPLRPDRMTVERVNGQRVYTYMTAEGKNRYFTADDILHIPAFGFDGLIGYSRISLARNAIGLSIAAEKFGSKFFANDARPGVVLKHPGKLGDKAYEHLRSSWNDEHRGGDNRWKPAILEEGVSVETIGIPPEDAQFLQTRQFQVAEIARIFRVPPHMIGDVSRTTSWGTGIDSQEQGYVAHTLRPWTVRIEQSLSQQLLLEKDRQYQFFEHLFDGLVRGDLATRYSAYVQALNNGFMSPNEVRGRENMNPYAGGDVFYRPLNMTGAGPSQTPAPAKAKMSVLDDTRAVNMRAGVYAVSGSNALAPLFEDVVYRVVKRELNDLSGAAKRLLWKDRKNEFTTWVSEFYASHVDFCMKQLTPVLDAQERLYGVNSVEHVHDVISAYVCERQDSLCTMDASELEIGLTRWQTDLTVGLCKELMAVMDGGVDGEE